ncbi:transposase [Chitinasiproducens palmae]|uniref:Putative transposase n=1 Tax=Chitinasiproducens palmae TaxID=1770053 RepID=A0A1H2PVM1_9BURK|nr:transposase [Chitinasiproducens palmae]SDV51316.1 putative transposase [Chitinasiproducens palmae]
MARLPRLYIPGLPQHVVLRTPDGRAAFIDDADRQRFLGCLRESVAQTRVALHAYVLLDDSVRWLGTPPDARAMSALVQAVGRRYVSYFNRRHGREGSLWESRYRATVLEPERYLLLCSRGIEAAAAERGLAAEAAAYRWSSHAHHVGLTVDPLVVDHALYWSLGNTPFERQRAYRDAAEQPVDAAARHEIEQATEKGWALASEAFLARHGRQASRRAAPLPRGRRPGAARRVSGDDA